MFSKFDLASLLLGMILSIAIVAATLVPTIHDEIKLLMDVLHSLIIVHVINVSIITPAILHAAFGSFSQSLETSQRSLGNIYIPLAAFCFSIIFLAFYDSGLSVTSYCALQRSVNILSVLGVASILIRKNSSLKFRRILLGVVFSFLCGQLIQAFRFLSQNFIFSVIPKILYSFTIILTSALVFHWFRYPWKDSNPEELHFTCYLISMSLYVCCNSVVYIAFNVLSMEDGNGFVLVSLMALQAFFVIPLSLIPEYQARSYALAIAQVMLDIKYKFVRFVAHKLHDPLSIVCIGLEYLFEDVQFARAAHETVELVQDVLASAQTANEILGELIRSQITETTASVPVELKVVNIVGAFADCFLHIVSCAENSNVNFQIDDGANIFRGMNSEESAIDAGELELNSLIDKKKIGQVLRNIISNAVKLTAPGGRVVLRTSLSPLRNDNRKSARVGELRVEVEHASVSASGLLVQPARANFDIFSMLPVFSTILNSGLNNGASDARWLNEEILKAHGGVIGTIHRGIRLGPNCTTWFELPVYEVADSIEDEPPSIGYVGLPDRVRTLHSSSHTIVYLIFVASCAILFFLPICVFGQNSLLSEAPISRYFKGSDPSLAVMYAPLGVLAPMLPLLLTVDDSLERGCIIMMETRVAALVFILRPILFALTRKTDNGVIIYIACIYLSYIVVAASLASSVQRLSPESVHWSLLVFLPSVLTVWAVFRIWSYCVGPLRFLLALSSILFYVFIAVVLVTAMARCNYLRKKYGRFNDAARGMSTADFCCSVYIFTPVLVVAMALIQNSILREYSWETFTPPAAVGGGIMQCLVMIPMVLIPLRIVRFHEMETAQRKLEQKELFGRYIGMEIRSPLNYVRTGLDLLRLQAPGDDASSQWNSVSGIDDLIEASAKAISILNDLLYCDDVESDVMQLNLTVVRVSGVFEQQLEAVTRTATEKNIDLLVERDETTTRQTRHAVPQSTTRHWVIVVEFRVLEKVVDKILSHAMEEASSGATLKLRIVSQLDGGAEEILVPESERSCLEVRGFLRIELIMSGTSSGRDALQALSAQEKYTLEGGEANLAGWVCRMFVEMQGGSMGCSVDAAASTSTLTVQFPLYMCDTSEKSLLVSRVQRQLAASKEPQTSAQNSRRVASNEQSTRGANSRVIMPWGRRSDDQDDRQQDERFRYSSDLAEDDAGADGVLLSRRSFAEISAARFASQTRCSFLIVDSSSASRNLLTRLIRSLGDHYHSATIIEVEDMSGALTTIALALQRDESIDCIIIDYGGTSSDVSTATAAALAPYVSTTVSAIRDRLGRRVKVVALFENERQLMRAGGSFEDELVEALVKPLTRASLASKLGSSRNHHAIALIQRGESIDEEAAVEIRSSESAAANIVARS